MMQQQEGSCTLGPHNEPIKTSNACVSEVPSMIARTKAVTAVSSITVVDRSD